MTIIEKYADKISGILHSYDRVNIKCSAGMFHYADGMTQFFNMMGYKCFDCHNVFKPITQGIIENAEALAKANDMEVEFIRSPKSFRKDDAIAEILKERGESEGLVKIWSQMETCATYKPWYDKASGKTKFKNDTTKCKVYYFYFMDRLLGLTFFDKQDEKILLAIADGNFTLNGFRAKNLKSVFPDMPSWKISNILKRLKSLGLIRKIKNSYRYHITKIGRDVIAAGVFLKNQFIVPALATA